MTLFLLTFFSLYSLMHVYAFFRARHAIPFGIPAGVCLGLFMLVMVLAPALVRLAERRGLESLARLLAWVGYTWMGVLFLFVSAALALDLWRLLVKAAGLILSRDLSFFSLSDRTAFCLSLAVALAIPLYGYFEARKIRIERITLASPKIPAAAGRIRVVQISDVHIGLLVRGERVKGILAKVREAEPDILLSTGDLVDGQMSDMAGIAEQFQEIRPRYGKYAVTGNHEFYAGLGQALDFTRKCGFECLRGEGVTVAGLCNIAGVDDQAGKQAGLYRDVPERTILAGLRRDLFTIFLKHRPVVDKDAVGLFDLQLSGHVHKGQIFPFNMVTHLFYPVKTGFSRQPPGSSLYVSRGTGTWGPPVRFLAPPEVTVIELVHAPGHGKRGE